jgi:hypothetical protein
VPVDDAWLQSGRFEVDVADTRVPAIASLKPLYDAEMKRIKM